MTLFLILYQQNIRSRTDQVHYRFENSDTAKHSVHCLKSKTRQREYCDQVNPAFQPRYGRNMHLLHFVPPLYDVSISIINSPAPRTRSFPPAPAPAGR